MAKSWYLEVFRKVHWDFDTPDYVENVGNRFSSEEFTKQLKKGKVQAVQFYAKDSFGYSYYDTEVGVRQPKLKRDLLGEISQACCENGIKVMFYYSCAIDDHVGRSHPHWCMNDGKEDMYEEGFHLVCYNSPYTDEVVLPQLKELAKNYPVDGFFLDHIREFTCHCSYCRERFKRECGGRGIPRGRGDSFWPDYIKWRHKNVESFLKKCANTVHKIKPEVVIGCNGVFDVWCLHPLIEEMDYLVSEAEGGEGCSFQARFFSTLGKPFDVMNTRFLYSWGDWMLKPINVLKEEYGTILANGGRCFLGDKMYPEGTLEPEVYRSIGESYQFVEEREKLLSGDNRPIPYIGILHSYSTFYSREIANRIDGLIPTEGAHKALMEGNFHFGILGEDTLAKNLKSYQTIIVPEQSHLPEKLAGKIREFVHSGGGLIASHKTSLYNEKGESSGEFQLSDVLGVKYQKESPHSYSYIKVEDAAVKENIGSLPLLVHGKFLYVEPTTATSLCSLVNPFAPKHSSERFGYGDAPPGEKSAYPAVVINHYGKGKAVYISGQVFRAFWEKKQIHLRYLINNLVSLVTRERIIEVKAPSCVEVSLFEKKNGYTLHLVNHQSKATDLNDYTLPIFDIKVSVKLREDPKRITQMPEEKNLPWQKSGDYITFEVPSVNIHSLIVIE